MSGQLPVWYLIQRENKIIQDRGIRMNRQNEHTGIGPGTIVRHFKRETLSAEEKRRTDISMWSGTWPIIRRQESSWSSIRRCTGSLEPFARPAEMFFLRWTGQSIRKSDSV